MKGRAAMADVLAAVVRDRQALPDPVIAIEHDREILMLDEGLVSVARDATRAAGLPHNAAREHFEGYILNTLTDMVAERIGTDPYDGSNMLDAGDITQIRDELAENPEVWSAIDQLWPRVTPRRLVADFLAAPEGYLGDADAAAVRRPATRAWTVADVPLLDEAAELLGEDSRSARARADRERETQIAYAQGVLDVSYASRTYEFDDKEDGDPDGSEVLSAHDIIDAERFAERHEEDDHRSAAERAAADRTWAFGHIIVDEAQELSAMAWRLLMRRSPTRSMTLVGDPAQTAEAAGAPGRGSSPRTSRTAGSTPASASTTAPPPRSWRSRQPSSARSIPASSRRARSAPPASGPGRAPPTTCPARSPTPWPN